MLTTILALASATAISSAAIGAGSQAIPRVVALGDSLTSGRGIGTAAAYPALLQQRATEKGLQYEFVNAGVSGDTSAGGLRRLSHALDGNVRVLILALGANDGLRGVPVVQVKTNLSRIIEAAQARGITVLLCGMEALPVHGWDYSIAFHNMYRDLAASYRVTLVPFILANIIGNPVLMQPDRAHPNAEGARLIAHTIWRYLEPALGVTVAQ